MIEETVRLSSMLVIESCFTPTDWEAGPMLASALS
jgi:hypothetical protein